MKDDPVGRVVVKRPDEAFGGLPVCVVDQNPPHEDMLAEAAQLAVVWLAKTVRPRTVARTTGKPAMAARFKNARRSSSTFCGVSGA